MKLHSTFAALGLAAIIAAVSAPDTSAQRTSRDREEKKQTERSKNDDDDNGPRTIIINDGGYGSSYPYPGTSAPPNFRALRRMPRILFTSDRRGDLDIYLMQENGSDIRRVTGRRGADTNAVFGPMKGRVVYVASPDPTGASGGSIAVMNADGKKSRVLFNGDKRNNFPAWSPDEQRIAFAAAATAAPESANSNSDLYIMDADGGNRRRLTKDGSRNTEPVFSPDGYRVSFVSDRDGTPAIYLMNSDGGGAIQRISPASLTGACSAPAFSPNGRFLVFACGDKTRSDLYLINADGTKLRRLTDNPSINTSPVFNPDSDRIAFSSNRSGNFAIYAIDINGTGLQQLTFGTSNDTLPSWGY